MTVRLSPHFTLDEFAVHEHKAFTKDQVLALKRLCVTALEPMRARFGLCTVTSGWRSGPYNKAVGGAKTSHHLELHYATSPAADVKFATGTPEQWAALAINLRCGGVGVYRTHVHIDLRRSPARW